MNVLMKSNGMNLSLTEAVCVLNNARNAFVSMLGDPQKLESAMNVLMKSNGMNLSRTEAVCVSNL